MGNDSISKPNKWWAVVVGVGLALLPIHNTWLTAWATNSKGETLFFLPAFGYILLIMGTGLFLLNNWELAKVSGWGDKRIVGGLLVIVLFMGISGFLTGDTIGAKFAPLLMGLSLVAVYLTARTLGIAVFRMLIPFVITGSIIAIVLGILNPGSPASETSGMITNYAAYAGFLLLGSVANQGKRQWALVATSLVGVFFIGATEALFIIAVVGIVILVRRDFNKRLNLIVITLLCLAGLWAITGHLTPLYTGNGNIAALFSLLFGWEPLTDGTVAILTSGRWEIIEQSLRDIRFFGHGYYLGTVGGGIVHNIPLIIVHQIGLVAGLVWLAVTILCLAKTSWKYVWVMILAMSVFDHYLWTQMSPWWWALIGVSTTSTVKNDLIFRRR